MSNREQPDQPDMQALADMIRGAASTEKQPHSGNIPLEQGGERPLPAHETDTPLHEAIGDIHEDTVPNDPSSLKPEPHETAHLDQATAARRPVMPPSPAGHPSEWANQYNQPASHNRRNAIVAGSTAAVLAVGALVYFVGLRGGDDKTANTADGHRQPGVSAPAKPGKANTGDQKLPGESIKKQPLITVTLDPRLSTTHTRLSDNQLQEIQGTGRPDTIDKQLASDIPHKTLELFVRYGYWERLLDQHPNWDALYQFHDHWVRDTNDTGDSVNNATMSSYSVIDGIYNDNYVLASELYGHPQQFRNPQTATLLGKAPIISVAELNKIAKQGGDSSEFWKQTLGRQVNYERALLSELDAGNTDPAVIDQIASYALVNNHAIGAVGQSRDEYQTALHQDLEKLYNRFMADPKKTEEEVMAQKQAEVTTQVAFMLDYHRQLAGYPQENDTATNAQGDMTITNGSIVAQSIMVQPDGKKVVQTTVSVVEFVAAPTTDTKHDYVMPVIVDQVSQTQPYPQ